MLAQLALSQAILFPEDAQERPVAKRYVVVRQTYLKASDKRSRGILDKVRESIVWNSLAPMIKYGPGFF
ncbi:hypothetical protein D3C72_1807320 [compost metagenome]